MDEFVQYRHSISHAYVTQRQVIRKLQSEGADVSKYGYNDPESLTDILKEQGMKLLGNIVFSI